MSRGWEGGGRSWNGGSGRGVRKPNEQKSGRTHLYPIDSDADLVEGLVEACGDAFRYIGETRRWMHYTGTCWEPDTAARIQESVKEVCREAADEASSERNAQNLVSQGRIAAVEKLARSHPRFRARSDQWDPDRMLLNTPVGTIDLRTGACREHRPSDCITRMTSVARDEEADHPLWTAILNNALPEGEERAFLQRFAGYCLTGMTTAQALLVAYGGGANSKGVIFNTIRSVMGDYAMSAASETFLSSRHERHPAELAVLAGARLVLVSEIDEGKVWNTMLLNRVTGGDPIIARVMRGDPFEFIPQFKPIMLTNNLPAVRGVNEATRRRFNILHFGVTIPKEQRDPDLAGKLRKEWGAILRWLVDGAVHFHERGALDPPASVQLSTEDYLDAENEIEGWLTEYVSCEDPNAWTSSVDLFESWRAWAQRTGAFVGSQKRLTAALKQMGHRSKRNSAGTARGFVGLRIMRSPD